MYSSSGIINRVDLRKIIKDEMQRQGVSQTKLQEMTGILQHRISEYLSGRRDVTAETLRKMLEALKLDIRPRRRRKGRR